MNKRIIALCYTVVLLLSGCAQEPEVSTAVSNPEPQITQSAPVPQIGGTLRLSMRPVQTLNPLLNEDASVDTILKLMFEPLIKLDESGKPVPNIADSWAFSDDGKTLMIHLKEDAAWHDGVRISARDVVFSLETIRAASDNSVYKKCIENVAGFRRLDENTLEINFNTAFSGNIYYMLFPVISADYYRNGNTIDSAQSVAPLGDGPFSFVSYTPARELMLQKAVNSFGAEPMIDNVLVLITQDRETDLYSFDQGVTDLVAADKTELGNYENSKNNSKYEYSTSAYDFIGFNFYRPQLADLSVRRAVAWSVPKDNLIENVYLNHAIPAETPISPKSWLYEEDTTHYEYDLSKARELLTEAGWIDANNDIVREKVIGESEYTLTFSILVNEENEERRQTALRMRDELKAVGFNITVEAVPYDTYVERLANKDFDLFIGGWQFSVVPDFNFIFHSTGTSNFISYNNPTMDAQLTMAYGAIGEDSMKSAYSDLQKLIAEDLPYVSLVYRTSAVFTGKRIGSDNIAPLESNIFDNIEEWFLVEQEEK